MNSHLHVLRAPTRATLGGRGDLLTCYHLDAKIVPKEVPAEVRPESTCNPVECLVLPPREYSSWRSRGWTPPHSRKDDPFNQQTSKRPSELSCCKTRSRTTLFVSISNACASSAKGFTQAPALAAGYIYPSLDLLFSRES
jgi:hypothetical protein